MDPGRVVGSLKFAQWKRKSLDGHCDPTLKVNSSWLRSDNDVKNHFHSKFRRAIRRINHLISALMRSEFKPLKNNLISKILKTSEDYYDQEDKSEETASKFCFGKMVHYTDIKNKIFSYLKKSETEVKNDLKNLKILIKEINQFSKLYKKKGRFRIDEEKKENR